MPQIGWIRRASVSGRTPNHPFRGRLAAPLAKITTDDPVRKAMNPLMPHTIMPKSPMPLLRLLAAALVAFFATATTARAESRIFLIDSSDGYGVDACLAMGAPCGERVATAWCRAHNYDRAIDFGRVANDATTPISSGSAANTACHGPLCPPVVAITCSR